MRRWAVLFAATSCLIWLAACQRGPAPTATPAPTTPPALTVSIPTATAPPAPSATPGATATPSLTPAEATPPSPTAPPTPDPNLGVGDIVYEDHFDGTSGWNWTFVEEGVVTFSIAGSRLNAVMTQGNVGLRYTIRPDISVGDQQLSVTAITNLCYERDEYGVLFRGVTDSNNNDHMYVFKLNCGGSARVERVHNLQATPAVDWTASPAIVSGAPAENRMMVWMADDQLHFYVNDKYLFSARDATFAEGFYGFYIRDRTNGGASVSYMDLVARAVTLP
jgi:hypothetical protein